VLLSSQNVNFMFQGSQAFGLGGFYAFKMLMKERIAIYISLDVLYSALLIYLLPVLDIHLEN